MEQAEIRVKQHDLLNFMPDVLAYKARLKIFDRQWGRITLTGKINSNRVASTLIDFMEGTQNKFLSLQENLIDTLACKSCDKVLQEMQGLSQVAIDILKRNLYERTADVGFLATDDDIVAFLCQDAPDPEAVPRIRERLRAYRDKYTVYDEIVIFDIYGNVRANLDASSTITRSADPLLLQALANDGYHETFRVSDLRPGKGAVLVYSHRILHPQTRAPLGVLCLCFDFVGEMEGIYRNLLQKSRAIIAILDAKGLVLSSSDPKQVPLGSSQAMVLDEDFRVIQAKGRKYLAKTARTNGYQGFVGLPWFGHVMYPVQEAFCTGTNLAGSGSGDARTTRLFSGQLKAIDDDADDILSDLGLVVLNGEVMAAKQIVNADPIIRQEANALPPVLGAIHQVGENIRGVFAESISSLLETVISSKLDDAKFLASLAIDIMDRNLYERANDCRWWALNSTFRRLLAKNRVEEGERKRLQEVLAYINSLYTVYTNLILYDRSGTVVATSNPAGGRLVGTTLRHAFIQKSLQLASMQQYVVSDFEPFATYAGAAGAPRCTYIYTAAVFHPGDEEQVVGGIAIVFDSEPQFAAMLADALPRDENGSIQAGSQALFVDREKRIIATTTPDWHVGDVLPVEEGLLALAGGEQASSVIDLDGRRYLAGRALSQGYREYKRDGGYTNDVAAMILIEI